MSRRNHHPHRSLAQHGFTLVELMIMIVISGIIATTFYAFMNSTLSRYLSLQKDGTDFTDLSYQSQRLAQVMRGLTDIVAVSADGVTCYAYFSPSDNYVSLIRYYKTTGNKELMAEVTPLTANPPTGTLITSQKRTYKIINNFYQASGVATFVYLDDVGNPLTLPVADQHSIKGVRVSLAARGANNSNQAISVQVSLRNRKTNL